MLPLGFSARPPGRPWATVGLALLLVAVWVRVQLLRDAPLAPYCSDLTESPRAVSRAAGSVQAFVCHWAVIPDEVAKGHQLYALVTATLLHVGWVHLLVNLAFLVAFAPRVEADLGRLPFLALFFDGGAAGALAHVVLVHDQLRSVVPTLGASGGVAAVLGAHAVLAPRATVRTLVLVVPMRLPTRFVIALWAGVQVFATARVVGSAEDVVATSFEAHVTGLLLGVLLAGLLVWLHPPTRGWPVERRRASSPPPATVGSGSDSGKA